MLDTRHLVLSSCIDYDHERARKGCFSSPGDHVTTGVGKFGIWTRCDQQIASAMRAEAVAASERCRSYFTW